MKCGFELELIAPDGESRASIAAHLAEVHSCTVGSYFHRESDLWPGDPASKSFHCLTRAFLLENDAGWQLKVANDMTIGRQIDLETSVSGDWYHILSDDIRIVDLIHTHCNAVDKTEEVLLPMAGLFGTQLQREDDIIKVVGPRSSLVCAAHARFSDRSRICEIITAPITRGHRQRLVSIIGATREMGCQIPLEAAFHIHFDGADFLDTRPFLRLIRYFHAWSGILRALIPPNPNCIRLGGYEDCVVEYAFDRDNDRRSWAETVASMKKLRAVKYCDFNFVNLLSARPEKTTVEIRTIPMTFDVDALLAATELFHGFLQFVRTTDLEYTGVLPVSQENIEELLNRITG
jgi:hypothetical protein